MLQTHTGAEFLRQSLLYHDIDKHLASSAGLSVDEMHCLTQLYLDHPCCVKRLTESLYVTATRTSKILRKLERRGMIARAIDQNDRRKERISLTDIGRSHAERILFLSAQAAEKLSVTKLD